MAPCPHVVLTGGAALGSVSCLAVGLLLFSLLGSSVAVLELEPGAEVTPWPLPPPSFLRPSSLRLVRK